ncbi:Cytochrome b-c1 complex subunit 6, mitochondrial [Conoideocrella luteorostrata]|uniref:Cytochrome b-c1 complex subunit 6, mitochondrial n=1 Tax=Conoideocrella luteorostrata TaxID=1105319 RepID=A0AAJ0FSW7_9HYPO|nr:Cytochrome b-c1 complex subunit 6, mitochondrial [Conoideocrella luteorostrata]
MGIWDAFSEIVEAVTPWSVVEAEAPAKEPKVRIDLSSSPWCTMRIVPSSPPPIAAAASGIDTPFGLVSLTKLSIQEEQAAETESKDEEATEESTEEATEESEESEEAEGEDEEEEEEEEEEEDDDEEEIVDPKETLEEECKNSAQCAPAKHHFDECVERVHQQESEGEAKEDCVEEFFHLAHCATACAAPKLWSKLR